MFVGRGRVVAGWSIFTIQVQELTSPRYPLRDTLKVFDATVTPSLFKASGTWTMTEEMKNKLQTTQPRMMRMIKQTKMKPRKSPAAAHAANAKKSHLHFQQRHKPTLFQVTRGLNRRHLHTIVSARCELFATQGRDEGPCILAFWASSELCVQGAGWRSGQCHCHDVEMLSDF